MDDFECNKLKTTGHCRSLSRTTDANERTSAAADDAVSPTSVGAGPLYRA